MKVTPLISVAMIDPETAARVADEVETYPGQAERHFSEVKLLLDRDQADYAT